MNVRKIIAQEQKECFKIECKDSLKIRDVLKFNLITFLLVIYFFVFLGFNFFYIAFPVHAVQALDWKLSQTGFFFSFLSIIMVLVQGPLLKRITKIWSDPLLVSIGSLILALSFLLFVSNSFWQVYLGAGILALGNGIMWPSLLSLISKSVPERFQGTIQGYCGSLGSVASIIGLLIGGILYNQIGEGIFVISALVILTIFFLSWRILAAKDFSNRR
jgi:MFS family permease